MPWFKVDDTFWGDPKVKSIPRKHRAGAIALWVMAGSWSTQHLTDGVIPDHAVRELGGSDELAQALVTAGLWSSSTDPVTHVTLDPVTHVTLDPVTHVTLDPVTHVTLVTHYLFTCNALHSLANDVASARREATAARVRAYRQRKRLDPVTHVTPDVTHVTPPVTRYTGVGNALHSSANDPTTRIKPLVAPSSLARGYQPPSEVKDGRAGLETNAREGGREAGPDRQNLPSPNSSPGSRVPGVDFENFFKVYPKKVSRTKAQLAFAKALGRATAKEIIAGAERYSHHPDVGRDGNRFIKNPENWLDGDCWNEQNPPPRKINGYDHGAEGVVFYGADGASTEEML